MRQAVTTAGITKSVTVHSLRHSYATHLIEDGLNIVTVKDLLGHSKIETTMVYLHVAQCPLIKAHSPLDTLYPQR
jgi:site-specific recombinase XerD